MYDIYRRPLTEERLEEAHDILVSNRGQEADLVERVGDLFLGHLPDLNALHRIYFAVRLAHDLNSILG